MAGSLRTLPIVLNALLAGCATSVSNTQSVPYTPVPMVEQPGAIPDIIVAANSEGIGASWSSVLESPLARTATELSNLGGAPIVAGAVGVILATDSGPRKRAARLSYALNADLPLKDLNQGLAEQLGQILPEEEADSEPLPVAHIRDVRDLPSDAYLLQTDYALAKDASAVRVTATVTHTDDIRRAIEIRELLREREFYRQQQRPYASGWSSRQSRRLRELMRGRPRYRGSYEYHSASIDLPDIGAASDDFLQERLLQAIDAEREARILAARQAHETAVSTTISDRKRRKAERTLAKALAKADSLHEKSREKAQDGEIDKMERLLLGMAYWQSGGETTHLVETIGDAHAFIAETLADRVSGSATHDGTDMFSTDDRLVVDVGNAAEGDKVISMPEYGPADYGAAIARP